MNQTPTSHKAERQKLREDLTDTIIFRIQQEIEDLITANIPGESRTAILGDFLSNSRYVLSALSVEELEIGLQGCAALERHVETTVASVKYLVHRIQEQQGRSF
jgi:hypothetical protein